MLHIYCGDGKGKTTAALGLALRAAGSGMRVCIIQFLKGAPTSELHTLARIPEITVKRCDRDYGFTFSMDETTKEQLTACHNRLLEYAMWCDCDLLILDEFFPAYTQNLLDRTLAARLVFGWQKEIVLTGRDPDESFLARADYVSEIHAVKHPYTKGISAREGIEF